MKFALLGIAAAYQTSFLGTDRVLRLSGEHALGAVEVEKAQQIIAELDVWGHAADGSLELRASPEHAKLFAGLGLNVSDATEEHEKHFNWFDQHYDEQVCTKSAQECANDPAWYTKYQALDAIHTYLGQLATQYSSIKTRSWGTSYGGLNQLGVSVTGTGGGNRPIVFYFCGEHAREWLPPMFCVYMAEELAARYARGDPAVTQYLNRYDFHILPVMNPDGYKYTMDPGDRMWRKSRKPNSGSSCWGTDLNRNYAYRWGTGGSSRDPCSETYMGTAPWDNVETNNLQRYATSNNIVIQTDVHAYGQMWMHPWGWTTAYPADDAQMSGAGQATVAAIRAVNGLNFAEGTIANVIYIASGSSCDYFYGQTGVVYAYAPEVRGSSFQPPATNIGPSNNELWAGMMAQVKYVYDNA